ncbi:MAG TPA: ABC transporter permease, partial [Chitinophagaceae bacterium]|nr:ABC transporter permease [Chitinophagaceae bacterium]
MLKKYFVTTLRYLWRQRLFTILNILGLSISISACWVIYRIIDYEFSYERKIPNKENIYRLITGFIFDEKERYNGGVSKPMYQVIREQIGNIDLVVPVFEQNVKLVEANKLNSKPLTFEDQKNIIATDSSYFSMLPYHWLSGNKLTAFKSPQSVVLTESRANQYFPGKKPDEIINETITYYSRKDTIKRIVTGIVVPDFDAPTEFIAKEFFSLPTKSYDLTSWTNTNGSDKLYLQLQPTANTSKIIKQIDDILLQKRKQFQQLQVSDFKL